MRRAGRKQTKPLVLQNVRRQLFLAYHDDLGRFEISRAQRCLTIFVEAPSRSCDMLLSVTRATVLISTAKNAVGGK